MKMNEVFEQLTEAMVIGRNHQQPLRDDETIRVYHATPTLETVVIALTRGISGGSAVARRYSYESNNNPRGLFVSPFLKVSQEFGPYVLEFHTRIRDLEAPVWPGGTFTGQGQMAQFFNDDDERNDAVLKQRAKLSTHELEYIRNSDRPDVAHWMLNAGESQALFTGSLNANSIRAIWVSDNPNHARSTYSRMTPREFLSMYQGHGIPNQFGGRYGPSEVAKTDEFKKSKQKLINPRDNLSGYEFLQVIGRKYSHMDQSEIIKILQKNSNYVRKAVWSDQQFNRIMNDIMRM